MEKQSPHGGTEGTSRGGSKRGMAMFVQADSACDFKDLVQRLTGPSSGNMAPAPATSPMAPKLHERRKYNTLNLNITKPIDNSFQFPTVLQPPGLPFSPVPMPCAVSPRSSFGSISSGWPASPSSPSFALSLSPPSSLACSPTTVAPAPLVPCSSNKRKSSFPIIELNPAEEEKAIKEKRFYLHPSPRSKLRVTPEPELLALFPLTSPSDDSADASKTTK